MLGENNHFISEFSRLRRQTNDTKDLSITLNIPRILYYTLNTYSFKVDKHYL